jgi:hypothetical protein
MGVSGVAMEFRTHTFNTIIEEFSKCKLNVADK